MGEILIGGMTEYPLMRYTDTSCMPERLKKRLASPDLPAHFRDPNNWPHAMKEEWADDEGEKAALLHRERLIAGVRNVRAELDRFAPDAIVLVMEEHFENFRENVLPPFCIFASDSHVVEPHYRRGIGQEWDEPEDTVWSVKGDRTVGRYIASKLLDSAFDVAVAYKGNNIERLAHTFSGVINYLDWDRSGFSIPVIPFHLNCYGDRYLQGELKAGDVDGLFDVGPPRPARCFDLGVALAQIILDSPWRIALLGGSSWSHATLTPKNGLLFPDQPADLRFYAALEAGDYEMWRSTTRAEILDAGQPEILTWFPTVGALSVVQPLKRYSEFVASYCFNSDKVFAIYAD